MAERTYSVTEDMHVLWITAGLGCDGDTVALTAATQPSLEDLIFGTIPGVPRMKLHNPVLAYEVGKEFLNAFNAAARGELEPFILVIEGSIPNEQIKEEGFWSGLGVNPKTGQPITVCEWIDKLATRQAACDFRIIWSGLGNPMLTSPSFVFLDVRSFPTTSPRHYYICSANRPGMLR